LSRENVENILHKELKELKKREGFVKQGLELSFSERLIQHLASEGFNAKYGARPLQQTIEREVIAPMAKWVLAHDKAKNKQLHLDYDQQLLVRMDKKNKKK
ncbi:MAG: hypothetical protein AAGI49_06070, partial [Bacteroidota bacterium]